MMEAIVTARSSEIKESGERNISEIYLFLGRCFSYPTGEFYNGIKGIEVQEELGLLVEGLPFDVDYKGIPSPSLPLDELESGYVNTFDITPPCPLYESSYTRDDMCGRDIYEDLLRFYEHFDIRLNDREKDYPDHLTAELEFMAFLTGKEADALERGKDAAPYRLAQLDFLERHLNKWVCKLDERIQKRVKEPFYKGASGFMKGFLDSHLLHLKRVLKRLN